MANAIHSLHKRATAKPRRIVFPETYDRRVIDAAQQFQESGLGTAVVITEQERVDPTWTPSVETVSLHDGDLIDHCARALHHNRRHKGLSLEGRNWR